MQMFQLLSRGGERGEREKGDRILPSLPFLFCSDPHLIRQAHHRGKQSASPRNTLTDTPGTAGQALGPLGPHTAGQCPARIRTLSSARPLPFSQREGPLQSVIRAPSPCCPHRGASQTRFKRFLGRRVAVGPPPGKPSFGQYFREVKLVR